MGDTKTPRQLIRLALLDAIRADADWSQRHIEDRYAELERIGDELLAALTPVPPVVACDACHEEREVSEHECCGNSTNGECCWQSVEVRVPCLFCFKNGCKCYEPKDKNNALRPERGEEGL